MGMSEAGAGSPQFSLQVLEPIPKSRIEPEAFVLSRLPIGGEYQPALSHGHSFRQFIQRKELCLHNLRARFEVSQRLALAQAAGEYHVYQAAVPVCCRRKQAQ